MRRFLLVLAAVLVACDTPVDRGGPALWKITDADSEIYLFGTVHVLPPDLNWRTEAFDTAFALSEELVLETEAAPEAQAQFGALAQRYGMLPEGETLSSKLDAADRARLTEAAEAARLNPATLEPLRPWLAALQLSLGYAVAQGQSPEHGVETVLYAEARAQEKRVTTLETPEEQIRTLADLPPAEEMRFLTATLRQIEADNGALNVIDDAWARGDVDALERLLEPEFAEAGEAAREALLTRRNERWADEIARRLEGSDDLFIAVGAAHLVGDDSVIALLRERGIAVEGPQIQSFRTPRNGDPESDTGGANSDSGSRPSARPE